MHLCDVLGNCLLLPDPVGDVTGDWPAPRRGQGPPRAVDWRKGFALTGCTPGQCCASSLRRAGRCCYIRRVFFFWLFSYVVSRPDDIDLK